MTKTAEEILAETSCLSISNVQRSKALTNGEVEILFDALRERRAQYILSTMTATDAEKPYLFRAANDIEALLNKLELLGSNK